MAQRKIGDHVFSVNPLLGEASFLLQPRIMPAVGEFVALYRLFIESFLKVIGEDGTSLDKELDVEQALALAGPVLEQAGPILGRLCDKLPPEKLRAIIRELLVGATMDGKLLYTNEGNPVDILMQGKTIIFWQLVVFALEVSYPDFFGVLGALRAPAAKAKEASAT